MEAPDSSKWTSEQKRFYALKAYRTTLDNLRATEHQRGLVLSKAAYACGHHIEGGYVDELEAKRELLSIAKQIGLKEGRARTIIDSGVRAGRKHQLGKRT